MLISYKRGQGSIVLRVKILNSSVSTGAGLTGLTFSSSGLIISTIADNEATAVAYTQAGSTIETITTLGTYAAPTATKCRFKEVDSTNHKGVYEIQIADTRFAVSSSKSLIVSISGATNLAETDVCIPLTDIDFYEPIRAALTSLPAFAAGANGGLPVLSSSATTLAYTVSTLTTYTGNTPQTGDAFARIGVAGAGLTALGDTRIANLDTTVGSRMATYTQPTGFLAAVFPSDPADQSLIIAATNALAASIAAVPDTVWDEALAGHLTAGTAGAALNASGGAADPWNTPLPGAYASGTAGFILGNVGGTVGPGSIEFTVTITDDMATPLDGAEVWVSTDEAGSNVIAGTLNTNAMGQATFLLDAGNYWLWVVHSGFNRDNPTSITVS